jgi:hypothetical protein
MKLKHVSIAIITLLISLSTTAADGPPTFRIRALIDGRSQLVVRPGAVYWEHFDWERPGRLSDQNEPTYLNSYVWYPQWPDTDDRHPGPSLPLSVVASFMTNQVAMEVISARWSVQILQQPDPTNGHTLIVEFDDNPFGAADWYEVVLSGVSVVVTSQLSIEVSQVRVCWNSATNTTYQVQYRSELTANAWVNLGTPIPGNGSRNCITDDVVSPRRFYQVVVLP